MTRGSAPILVANSCQLFDFLSQITSGVHHLLHRLLRRVFRIPSELGNASRYLLSILLDLFRLRESATHLLQACLQEAPGLFSTQEEND